MTIADNPALSRRTLMRTVAGAGGAVLLGGAAALADDAPAHAATDSRFRWCRRCQGMWFIAGGNNGHCPVEHWWDHSHYQDGSATYSFIDVRRPAPSDDAFGQIALTWCLTCKAAYFWQDQGTQVWPDRICPNNTAGHTPSAARYRVEMEQLPPLSGRPKQPGWRRCGQCKVMYTILNGTASTQCPASPATGQHHEGWLLTPSGWQVERYLARW